MSLRKKEEEVKRDTLDGLNIYARGKATLNESIERYLSLRSDLRPNTYSGYIYIYNYFVKEQIRKRKIADIKYSDILMFYKDMYDNKGYIFILLIMRRIGLVKCLLQRITLKN